MKTISIDPIKANIAVIGGGIFGTLAAIRLAEAGCQVTIFEAGGDLLCGASLANQNRLHLGYHYPRSPQTARACEIFERGFRRCFPECINDFDHYYAIAEEGNIRPPDFTDVCNEIGHPFEVVSGKNIVETTDKIPALYKVNEGVIDAGLLRNRIKRTIRANKNISIKYFNTITDVRRSGNAWYLDNHPFSVVINATYGNINRIIQSAGFDTDVYQYELCEVVVIKNPFKRHIGIGIMDGPFFGVIPFGNSENHLLYDVDYSVLERVVSRLPDSEFTIEYYSDKLSEAKRFKLYIDKASQYLPDMARAERLYSLYAVKVTKANRDADDARPTEIISHGDGFYSIFAGKISAAIPAADIITREIQCYLN